MISLYSDNHFKWQLLSRRKLTTNLYRMSGEPLSHLQSKSKYYSCLFECLIVNIKTNLIVNIKTDHLSLVHLLSVFNSQIWASKLQRISWEKNQVNYWIEILRTEISKSIKNTTNAFSSGSCGKLTETRSTSESRYWIQPVYHFIIDHHKGLWNFSSDLYWSSIIIFRQK